MPFEKGQSGNPGGRRKEKPFLDALNLALSADDRRKLRAIAEKLVTAAEDGQSWAIQEIANRLDGKPAQALEHTGEDGGAIIHEVVRRIVHAGTEPKPND